MSIIETEVSDSSALRMANLTVHGAATYGRVEGREYLNMTEREYLSLVLGPQRQDDKVGLLLLSIFLFCQAFLTLLLFWWALSLFCRKDKLPQRIDNNNSHRNNSFLLIHNWVEFSSLPLFGTFPFTALILYVINCLSRFILGPICFIILLVTRLCCGRWQYFTWSSSSRGCWATCPSSWWSSRARVCTAPWTTISSPSPWRTFWSSSSVTLAGQQPD